MTAVAVTLLGGCSGISIAPACPNELLIGESGIVTANEINPGAIAQYLWEVLPPEAGTFEDASQPMTQFTASSAVEATIRLTASDGIYQVISQCTTRIIDLDIAVSLQVTPATAVVGQTAVLTCTSVGQTAATTLTVTQTGGTTVELGGVSPGIVAFTAEQAGTFEFECVGETDGGARSESVSRTVTVIEPPDGTDNGNTNDNSSGGRPPPGGRR